MEELVFSYFGMLTQGLSYMQIILLITVPKIYFIERQSRNLIHVMFEATDVQGIMKPKLPFPSPYHDDKIWGIHLMEFL